MKFLRWLGHILEMPSGYYRAGRHPSGVRTATLRCPSCHQTFNIANHHIRADGVVQPSVICPHEPCTFHPDNTVLED